MTYYYVSGQDQSAQGVPPQGARGQWVQPGGQGQVQPQKGYGTVQGMGAGAGGSGAGQGQSGGEGSGQVPPSYEQAIKGDNKQQT